MKLLHVLCIFAILPAGCATNIGKNYDLSKQKAKGVAVFSVTHDKGPLFTRNIAMCFKFSGESLGNREIVVSSHDGPGLGVLGPSMEIEGVYGKIKAIEFPAGRNQLTDWSIDWSIYTGGTCSDLYRAHRPLTFRPLTFEIKPGSVTYLGNLHGSLTKGRNYLGMTIVADARPEIRDNSERDLKLVQRLYPQFAGKINIELLPTGPWVSARATSGTSGNTSVYHAASRGDTEAVAALISSGGDPNERGAQGWTPLMIATAEGHSQTVRVLIKAGATVDTKNNSDRTALMFATRYGFEYIVTELVEAGANVNLVDQEGWGALWAAVREGHVSLVKLLLQEGANPNVKDRDGKTILDWAKRTGNREIIEMIEQALANTKLGAAFNVTVT